MIELTLKNSLFNSNASYLLFFSITNFIKFHNPAKLIFEIFIKINFTKKFISSVLNNLYSNISLTIFIEFEIFFSKR